MTLIVKSVQKRWPGGCIVFRIQDDPNFDDAGRAWVKLWRTAIQEWSQAGTDLRFIERTVQDSFVTFVMDPGLSIQGQSEEVGMKGGEQLIRLAPITPDSDQVRTSRHELGHTIGMYHEHQRPDRDDFITIDEANIKDIFCWFRIMLMITDETMVENYNVRSIMHYSAKKECSKDGRTAIIKRKDGSELPKQGNSIKPTDIRSAAALNAGNLHIYQLSHGGQIEKTIQQANIKSGITAICPYALDARRFLLFLRHAGGRGGLRAANMNSDGSMGDRVAYKTVTSGWTAMDSYGILGSTFAFLYKAREGLAKVRRIEVNGNIASSSTSPEMQLERGWTVVSHYAVGFNNFLIFVNSITGQAQVRHVSADGLPHDIVQSRKVFVGWTTVQAVHIGSKTYLCMLKASTGKVHIRRIQDNGKIGEVIHYGQIAPGFNIGIPYRVIGGYFLFLLNSDTGKVEIREICQDGSIGTVTDTRLFSTGWESAAIYDVDPGKYVVLIKPGS